MAHKARLNSVERQTEKIKKQAREKMESFFKSFSESELELIAAGDGETIEKFSNRVMAGFGSESEFTKVYDLSLTQEEKDELRKTEKEIKKKTVPEFTAQVSERFHPRL